MDKSFFSLTKRLISSIMKLKQLTITISITNQDILNYRITRFKKQIGK